MLYLPKDATSVLLGPIVDSTTGLPKSSQVVYAEEVFINGAAVGGHTSVGTTNSAGLLDFSCEAYSGTVGIIHRIDIQTSLALPYFEQLYTVAADGEMPVALPNPVDISTNETVITTE